MNSGNDSDNKIDDEISIGNIDDDVNLLNNFQDEGESNISISDLKRKSKSDIEPLYVMTLELAKGKNELIKIYPDSNATELAFNFCRTNNLDFSALVYLKDEIDNLMKKNHTQDEDSKLLYDQLQSLSKGSNRSSSKLLSTHLIIPRTKKSIEGGDNISSINKNNSQISKDESSISESLLKNVISASKYYCKNNANSSKDNKGSFSFSVNQMKRSGSTYSKISHNIKYQPRDQTNNLQKLKNKKISFSPNQFDQETQSLLLNDQGNKNKGKGNNAKKNTKEEHRKEAPLFFANTIQVNHQCHNRLMKDNIKKSMQESNKKFTFHPKINQNHQLQSKQSFLERQENFSLKVKEKNHDLSQFIYSNNDDPLFHPKLISKQISNQDSYYEANPKNNVFDKNFDYATKYKKSKEILSEKYYNDVTKKNTTTSPTSNKIVSSLYIEAFTKIFNQIDNDNDGIITAVSYSLKQLPSDIIKIINPIVMKVREHNQTLTHKEFIIIMEYLCLNNGISSHEKKIILEYNKKQHRTSSSSRATTSNSIDYCNKLVNDKSRKLAVNHQKKMIRSLSALNIGSNHRHVTKNKFFINQPSTKSDRKMDSKSNLYNQYIILVIKHVTFDYFKQSVF